MTAATRRNRDELERIKGSELVVVRNCVLMYDAHELPYLKLLQVASEGYGLKRSARPETQAMKRIEMASRVKPCPSDLAYPPFLPVKEVMKMNVADLPISQEVEHPIDVELLGIYHHGDHNFFSAVGPDCGAAGTTL